MPRILFLRRGALGDTVLCVPVLRALRRAWPTVPIDAAGQGDFVPLLEHYGVVDRAMSSETLSLWARTGPAAGRARAALAAYSRVIADTPPPPGMAEGGWVTFDPRVTGDDRRPAWRQLAARVYARLPEVGEPEGPPALRASRLAAEATAVVLHPGSGSPRKCWPLERWRELAEQLVRRRLDVRVVLGPAEEGLCWSGPGAVHRPADVIALARLLETAAAFAGHDSGVTHVAAALRIPTVALFGPTDPAVWAPSGAHVCVLASRTPGPPDAAVGEVLAALAER